MVDVSHVDIPNTLLIVCNSLIEIINALKPCTEFVIVPCHRLLIVQTLGKCLKLLG